MDFVMTRRVLLLTAVLLATLHVAAASRGAYSLAKSQHSNPVLPVVVEGKTVNLILTTDVDGVLLCEDRPGALPLPTERIDYGDYARKLLRYQLSGMTLSTVPVIISIPSLGVSPQSVSASVFYISLQTLSPAALAFFLHHADADGFIGIGYAFRLKTSPFWNLLDPNYQYTLTTTNYTYPRQSNAQSDEISPVPIIINESDYVAGQVESEQSELDWSEPWGSVDQADDTNHPNGQGLGFAVYEAQFQCTKPSMESTPQDDDAITLNDVDMFGDLTSHWDAIVDLNSPCLALPQQFYNSLAGWTGLLYDEDAKVSVMPVETPLPQLSFALSYQGPRHVVDLNVLVLNSSFATKSVCIQRSSSIVHNGASVFSSIDTESTAQRYRVHGTMMLPVYNMLQAPIVLGVMVLRTLDTLIVDGEAKQIAMKHPNAIQQSRKSLSANTMPVCLPSPMCIGQQEFSPRLNACLDPGCQSYFFQHLDPDTKTCVIDSDWLTFLYTTVAVFVSAELLLTSSISRMVARAIAAANSV